MTHASPASAYQVAWQRTPKGRAYRKKVRDEVRARVRGVIAAERLGRGNVCMDCGADEKLEWHHRDPSTKRFGITQAIIRVSNLDIVREELAKCDLLCRDCHVYGRHGWEKSGGTE